MDAEMASIVNSGRPNNTIKFIRNKNNILTRFYFKLTITLLFYYVSWQQRIGNNKKCRQIAGNFNCHVDVAVQRGAHPHRLIEHIQGLTRSHWMPPSSKCLHHIALAAAMVDRFVETTLSTNITQLLPSNYGTCWSLVVYENVVPQNGPSTQLIDIDVTSCIKMWNATIGAEELANISSYQTLPADKIWKSLVINSLPVIVVYERPLFYELFWWIVSSAIFVRC